MKVLLVNPPWYRLQGRNFDAVPLGLCYIAAVLREGGHKVWVYNADFMSSRQTRSHSKTIFNILAVSKGKETPHEMYMEALCSLDHPIWREVKDQISICRPDAVGITVMTPKYGSAMNVARIAKEVDADVPVLVGGVHPTVLPEQTAREDCVDYVVRGEGEFACLELVNTLERGYSPTTVEGVTFVKDDHIVHNPARPLIPDLDGLPFPARDLLINRQTYPPSAFGSLFTSRGCPYHCIYCESHKVWGRSARFRSPENVVEEIRQVKREYGTSIFDFEDDSFTLDNERTVRICEMLVRENLNISWRCDTRVNILTRPLLAMMKQAGLQTVNIGVESGDPEILRKIGKGITLDQVERVVSWCKELKINILAYFMVGFPWEGKREVMNTKKVMERLENCFLSLNVVSPYPGSKLYEIAQEVGNIHTSQDWSTFYHQSPDMGVCKIPRKEFVMLVAEMQKVVANRNRGLMIRHALAPYYLIPNLASVLRDPRKLERALSELLVR